MTAGVRADPDAPPRRAAVGGALAALAVLARPSSVLAAALLALVTRSRRRAGAFVVAFVLFWVAGYGVMSTPGLVVDEKVLVSGRVPRAAEIRDLLAAAAS